MEESYDREMRDGVRYSWNNWPCNKVSAARAVVPVGCVYTPLKDIEGMPLVNYEPVKCACCGAVLNPMCTVDFRYKVWYCSCCNHKNSFPQHYAAHISEQQLPAELMPDFTTIEYVLPTTPGQQAPAKPIFLIMVDTAVEADELSELKDSLQQSINFIPEDALIGLITYGKMAFVHELGFQHCPKAYVFKGDKVLTPEEIKKQLGLGMAGDPLKQGDSEALRRFLVPVAECEFALNSILDDLQPDPWPTKHGNRPARCSGTALNIAISMLEMAGSAKSGSRVINLMGGAVTIGPGKIVAEELTEKIRSHLDIQKERENTRHLKPATKFYQECAVRAQKAGIVLDVFVSALDQVGIIEMKSCFEMTGGFYIMTDSFGNPVFKESFKKFFEVDDNGDLKMGFLTQVSVFTQPNEFKVSGAIGQCAPVKVEKNNFVSSTEIGVGQTNTWYLGGMDRNKSLALYFDVVSTQNLTQKKKIYMQFQTRYQHVNGSTRLRVTTVQKMMSAAEDLRDLAYGFDQETAAVLVSRYSVFKTLQEETMDVIRWIDRMLIKLTARFAEFKKDDAASFKMSREFALFPQFMFYLRRSNFLQTFNASPDESEYYRSLIQRENVSNSLVMIQPALMQYNLDSREPTPVLLDIDSMQDDVVLLLDTFFYICIWKGGTIASWEEQKFHEDPEYENVKNLLEDPVADAQGIMQERFPMPRFFITKPNDTNERKIKVRVNPSSLSNQNSTVESNNYFTEDVSLSVFMQHLINMAVSSS